MKKLTFLFLLFCAAFSLGVSAQTAYAVSPLESFFRNQGVKTLAESAHLHNTYSEGTYSIAGNSVTVEVMYTNGTKETIRFYYDRSGNSFYGVTTSGDESFYSFVATKTWLATDLGVQIRKILRDCFYTSLDDISPNRLGALLLTAAWWRWNNIACSSR